MSIEAAHLARWQALKKGIPYDPSFAIPTFWRQHPELGSPLGPEIDLGNGAAVQAFSGGVVKWTPDGGAELVTE